MAKKNVNGQMNKVEAEVNQQPVEPADAASDDTQAAAEAAPEAPAPSVETAASAENLAEELRQAKDQLLRQAAEFQNYRRRTEKEQAVARQRGQIQVIEVMLDVLDDFHRSLEASKQVEEQETPGPAYQALKSGVDLVYKNFTDALDKLGVEPIEAVGHPFDENLHEAMMQMPAPDGTEPGVVVQEIQRGYRLGGRVLRHSKVIVAA